MSVPARRDRRPVLGVVVPVHNEQDLLGDCLDSLHASVRTVATRARVRLVVVLDDCSDRSELIARAHGVEIVPVRARNVGQARHTGAASLVAAPRPVSWLASTDAGSQVPPDWLAAHLDALQGGWDAMTGTVRVADWEDHPPSTRAWFRGVYENPGGPPSVSAESTHPHVHGANLGVRATSYSAVGGFPAVTTGEDVALIDRIGRSGHHILRTRTVPVLTSARAVARAPHGFAAHLLRVPHDLHPDHIAMTQGAP